MKHAIIKSGIVVNIVVWDGDKDGWQPADGQIAVPATDDVTIGYKYAAGIFTNPNPPAQPALPTAVELKAAAIDKVRAERKLIMGMLDGMQASALAKADVPRANVIETAKQGLRDLTKIDTGTCVTAADFKVLFVGRYRVIAGALPADVRLAFAEALL